MLNPRYTVSILVVILFMMALPSATWAVCAQGVPPRPIPMYYPGELCVQPGCCPGPCMCIPSVSTWGWHQRGWSQWPGDETRADIRFKQGIGIEIIKTPTGTVPETLPKEEYTEPKLDTGPGINIGEGATTTTPGETTTPFDFGPGFGEGLSGLDLPPEGPAPDQPPAENVPEEGGLPGLPVEPKSSVPPPPMPGEGSALPPNINRKPVLESPKYAISRTPGMEQNAPLAPMPSKAARPEDILASVPSLNEKPASPIDTIAETRGGELPAVKPVQATLLNDKKSLNGTTPSAPLEQPYFDPAPLPPEIDLPNEDFATEQAAQASGDLKAWKSRRETAPPQKARAVDYQEPTKAAKVGIDGYCPVELISNEKWVAGNPRWSAQYKGQTYRMSGPRQQQLFRANPERYAPVLSGHDLVLVVTGEGWVAGKTDACVIYQGRLLMFSSPASVAQFRQAPKRFIDRLANLNK